MSWEQWNDPTTLMMLAASAVLAAFALAGILMGRSAADKRCWKQKVANRELAFKHIVASAGAAAPILDAARPGEVIPIVPGANFVPAGTYTLETVVAAGDGNFGVKLQDGSVEVLQLRRVDAGGDVSRGTDNS